MVYLSTEVKQDIKALLEAIIVTTPRDVSEGDCDQCATGDCDCDYMELTVACNESGDQFNYQTGDNSFTGGAYGLPHWAVLNLWHGFDVDYIHTDIVDQLEALLNS